MLELCMCHKAQAHLSVNRLGFFHLHTCPGALTRCDKSGARSEGRVSYLVDTGVSYVHEFPLINVLVFTTAAHLQVNGQYERGGGGEQRIDHGGKAIILARRGHPRTALNALYEVRFGR